LDVVSLHEQLKAGKQAMYDLIIVGSGPSGLSAALSAERHGLDYLVLERGVIANTIYNYPVARPLFSTSNEVELEPGALPNESKPTREQVLTHYAQLVSRNRINIHTGEDVQQIERVGEGFHVITGSNQYRAYAVLVATGGFGRQRKLNVPGEDTSRVSYRFIDAHPYATKTVLVVGGGNSAAEAALFLAEVGANVTLSIRRGVAQAAGRESSYIALPEQIKPWVRKPLEAAANEGVIKIFTSSEVVEICPRSAILRIARDQKSDIVEIECDHIFALIGADPDTRLLEEAGAEIAADGRPVYDSQTCETTVQGLYVAGHITREMHIENAIKFAQQVVSNVASQSLLKA
jgi:thioredoxin reductase (NADPH)